MIETRYLKMGLTVAAAILLSLPSAPAQLEAQQAQSRMRVLVANLQPTDGTRDRFGERVANEIRNLIDLDTHVAMSSRDIDQAAREFDLRLSNLDCITARQLAAQINAGLVFCGQYHTEDGLIHYTGSFWTVPAGEEVPIPPGALPENDDRVAARGVVDFFQETVERLNQITYCGLDFNSSNWDGALQYCTRAVELMPESVEARRALARTYMELERYEESLEQFEVLLEQDPYSSSSLETAGWVAAQLGEQQKSREYFGRYLDLNPDNVQVRITIAYDLAQAGDDIGSMQLLRGGFEHDPDNIELHERYGATAFRAAQQLQGMRPQPAQQDGDRPALDPEVAELFREAVGSLERVMEERGAETPPTYVVNSMRAYVQLGEIENAVALGQRVVQHFRENPQVLSELALNYSRAGQVDEAVTHMTQALEINPDLPDARFRMANLLLEAGRVDEAVEWIQRSAQAGEREPDVLAGVLLGHGWNQGVQAGNRALGLRLFPLAKEVPGISAQFRSQADFFHAYALYQEGEARQAPSNLESARASLPIFQEALRLFEGGRAYASQANQDVEQFITASNTFIEIQEMIIARETR